MRDNTQRPLEHAMPIPTINIKTILSEFQVFLLSNRLKHLELCNRLGWGGDLKVVHWIFPISDQHPPLITLCQGELYVTNLTIEFRFGSINGSLQTGWIGFSPDCCLHPALVHAVRRVRDVNRPFQFQDLR